MARAVLDYAQQIQTDVNQFDKILSVTDTTVQKALETLDEYEPDFSAYVPYIGATSDVNLGVYKLVTDGVDFSLTPTNANVVGGLRWNATDETLDLGMPDNITLQIGQENQIKARNNTGSTILNGQVVYISGSLGNRPTIALAKGDSHSTAMVVGVATQDIPDNSDGKITTQGYVRDIDTTAWTEGDMLWLSKTTAGAMQNSEPSAPHHSSVIGTVTKSHITQGSILVNTVHHSSLERLSDVNGTALTVTGQFPVWNNTAGYFDFDYNITDYALSSSLSAYALLDGTNQPFTGNVTVSKANPKLIVTDTGLSSSLWLEKDTTVDGSRLVSQNRVFLPENAIVTGATRGNVSGWTLVGDFSLSFWFKPTVAGQTYILDTASTVLYVRSSATSPPYFSTTNGFGSGSRTDWQTVAGTPAFTNGAWWHVVFVRSGTQGNFYVNGVLCNVILGSATVGNANVVPTKIFTESATSDEWLVYNKALSAGEIAALYNGGAPVRISDYTNVYAAFHFNQSSGTTANGSSVNCRHIIGLTGCSWTTGIVAASTPQALSDIPLLRVINNGTPNSYGTFTNGYYSGVYGTSNIYEGLTHQFNCLGSMVASLNGKQVIYGHSNTDSRANSIILGTGNTAAATSGTEPLLLVGVSNTGSGQHLDIRIRKLSYWFFYYRYR